MSAAVWGLLDKLRLSDVCGGRDNNLNLVRMLAASAVLISHSFSVTYGPEFPEPLETLTGRSLGWLSVAVFFVISGFLISRSFDRKSLVSHWLAARIFRLYPGLTIALFVTVFTLGLTATTMSVVEFIAEPLTWSYIAANLSLAIRQYNLPGVFLDNPLSQNFNGSLWTLFYEVLCYAGVLAAGLLGILKRRMLFGVALCLFLIVYATVLINGPYAGGVLWRVNALAQLAFPFMLGMTAYVWREHLLLDWRIATALVVLCIPAWFTPMFTQALLVAVSYATLWIAYVPRGLIRLYNNLGDYSYGVYIYAFPFQQFVWHSFPGQEWYQNALLAAAPTLFCAVLSWHLVEKRALDYVKPNGGFWRLTPGLANT